MCVRQSACVQLICSLMTLSTWCSAVEWLSVWIHWRGGTGVWTDGWDWGAPQWEGGGSQVPSLWWMYGIWTVRMGQACCMSQERKRWNIWYGFPSVTCHWHVENPTWRWLTINRGFLDTRKIPHLEYYLSLNITANWIIFFGGHPWPITAV